jgi:hypothetical protein
LESSRPRARHGPRCTSSVRTADRRSVGGFRRTRAGRGHRATAASSWSCPRQCDRAALFKPSAFPSSSHHHHCPSRHSRRPR